MPIVLTAFLARVKPVSTIANPTCMNMTRKPAMSTHARLSDCSLSSPPGRGGVNAGRPRRRVAQIVEEFGRGLVAIAGVALDGLEQDGLERRVEAGHKVAGRSRFAVGFGAHHGKRVRPGERQIACEHFIEDGTERVDVGARVSAPPADLLRRDVVGRTDGGREAVPGEPASRLVERDAEVDDLHLPRGCDQDVLWLQVAMHDSVAMHVLERLADLLRDGERACGGERVLLPLALPQAL